MTISPIAPKRRLRGPGMFAAGCADFLQRIYEKHRVCETWGSPSVSQHAFERLRRLGFRAAYSYILQRLRETGRPDLSAGQKLTALVTGVTIVTVADHFLKQEKRPEMKVGAVRTFSPHAPVLPVALYVLGAALLVAASRYPGSSGPGGGGDEEAETSGLYLAYPGSDSSVDFRAYTQTNTEDGKEDEEDPEVLDIQDIREMRWRDDYGNN